MSSEREKRRAIQTKKQIKKRLSQQGVSLKEKRALRKALKDLQKKPKTTPSYLVTYTEGGEAKEKTFKTEVEAEAFIADWKATHKDPHPPKRKIEEGIVYDWSYTWERWLPTISPDKYFWSEKWQRWMPKSREYHVKYTEEGAEKTKTFLTEKEAKEFQAEIQASQTRYAVTYTEGGVEKQETFETEAEAQDFIDAFIPEVPTKKGKTRTQKIRARRKARRKKLKKLGRMDLVGPAKKEEDRASRKAEREDVLSGVAYEKAEIDFEITHLMGISTPTVEELDLRLERARREPQTLIEREPDVSDIIYRRAGHPDEEPIVDPSKISGYILDAVEAEGRGTDRARKSLSQDYIIDAVEAKGRQVDIERRPPMSRVYEAEDLARDLLAQEEAAPQEYKLNLENIASELEAKAAKMEKIDPSTAEPGYKYDMAEVEKYNERINQFLTESGLASSALRGDISFEEAQAQMAEDPLYTLEGDVESLHEYMGVMMGHRRDYLAYLTDVGAAATSYQTWAEKSKLEIEFQSVKAKKAWEEKEKYEKTVEAITYGTGAQASKLEHMGELADPALEMLPEWSRFQGPKPGTVGWQIGRGVDKILTAWETTIVGGPPKAVKEDGKWVLEKDSTGRMKLKLVERPGLIGVFEKETEIFGEGARTVKGARRIALATVAASSLATGYLSAGALLMFNPKTVGRFVGGAVETVGRLPGLVTSNVKIDRSRGYDPLVKQRLLKRVETAVRADPLMFTTKIPMMVLGSYLAGEGVGYALKRLGIGGKSEVHRLDDLDVDAGPSKLTYIDDELTAPESRVVGEATRKKVPRVVAEIVEEEMKAFTPEEVIAIQHKTKYLSTDPALAKLQLGDDVYGIMPDELGRIAGSTDDVYGSLVSRMSHIDPADLDVVEYHALTRLRLGDQGLLPDELAELTSTKPSTSSQVIQQLLEEGEATVKGPIRSRVIQAGAEGVLKLDDDILRFESGAPAQWKEAQPHLLLGEQPSSSTLFRESPLDELFQLEETGQRYTPWMRTHQQPGLTDSLRSIEQQYPRDVAITRELTGLEATASLDDVKSLAFADDLYQLEPEASLTVPRVRRIPQTRQELYDFGGQWLDEAPEYVLEEGQHRFDVLSGYGEPKAGMGYEEWIESIKKAPESGPKTPLSRDLPSQGLPESMRELEKSLSRDIGIMKDLVDGEVPRDIVPSGAGYDVGEAGEVSALRMESRLIDEIVRGGPAVGTGRVSLPRAPTLEATILGAAIASTPFPAKYAETLTPIFHPLPEHDLLRTTLPATPAMEDLPKLPKVTPKLDVTPPFLKEDMKVDTEERIRRREKHDVLPGIKPIMDTRIIPIQEDVIKSITDVGITPSEDEAVKPIEKTTPIHEAKITPLLNIVPDVDVKPKRRISPIVDVKVGPDVSTSIITLPMLREKVTPDIIQIPTPKITPTQEITQFEVSKLRDITLEKLGTPQLPGLTVTPVQRTTPRLPPSFFPPPPFPLLWPQAPKSKRRYYGRKAPWAGWTKKLIPIKDPSDIMRDLLGGGKPRKKRKKKRKTKKRKTTRRRKRK